MKNDTEALDGFDLAILRILQKDNTLPHRLIGEQVNLSPPSVQRRIKRLVAAGIITNQSAIVDPARLGRPLTIIVEVELKAETGGAIDLVKQSFADAPEVQQCYYVTGETDFILIIVVRDMSKYEALTQRLFFSNDTIRKFKTFVTMDRTKVSLSVDI
ncbi:Lrp/AsnC family transcriptional regulator [Ascidiaceihabitans sp.]|uniref:Lrp/AsnC family transcriptional regulator n=1 Tax=Ascidiaceihabitans sp. TaxID=1872644 RepID=UPI00329982A3